VTVRNLDQAAHTWTETSGPMPFFDESLPVGASVTYTFRTKSTYHYECRIHTFMTGTVIVT
jgi:plastocyanin